MRKITTHGSDWCRVTLDAACVSIAIACAARTAAGDVWALSWLTNYKAWTFLLAALAVSFTLLAAKGWRQHRSLSVAIVSLIGTAAIAAASLVCNANCAANCAGRGTGAFLLLFGGLVLVVAVLENENLALERSQRRSNGRRR